MALSPGTKRQYEATFGGVVTLDGLHSAARDVAQVVAQKRRRWFIDCDTDADGVCAAAVVASALLRAGHTFQIRGSRGKSTQDYEDVMGHDAEGFMFLDKGTSHVADLARLAAGRPVIVIDHHNIPGETPEGIHLLNPRSVGLDGSNDACSSTTAVAFALALVGEVAWQWAGIGLVGAIGDWQHMGGWDGWNKVLVAEGKERGVLVERKRPGFVGVDLADAVARRAPALPGVTDRASAAAFLSSIGVPAVGDVEMLDMAAATRLTTGIVLGGLVEKVAPSALQRIVMENLEDTRRGGLRPLFRTVDACGRAGDVGTGIALLLGDAAARPRAEELFTRYKDAIVAAIDRLREEGTVPRRACQVFHIEEPQYTGMVGGLGMTVVVGDRSRPMVVFAPRPDGDVQVSTRGTESQVQAGMDLGAACHVSAQHVGREGGGHPVAAGAVIGPDDEDAFLAALDDALVGQGWQERLAQ